MQLYAGLGSRIRQVRGERTQKTFAQAHGTSQGYISDLEHDRAQPSFHFLVSMMNKEDVSLDWLMSGRGNQHPTGLLLGTSTGSIHLGGEQSSEIYQKLEQLIRLRPDLSQTLKSFIESLLKE
ncbi:MAG: helix-turn-helix transcriptional regulator [Acidobacteria bacterium]|nr:helix-turn-helix transcriptional regulator [Acidobacteriota bacterium]